MISKNLFLIWLGDNIPNYTNNVILAYQTANQDFNIQFIHFTISQIENIYKNKIINNANEKLLYDSISVILNRNSKYQNRPNKTYMYVIDNQRLCYGKNIRFIQLLSDIYRLKLIDYYGGIYVDCDTFPLKPFDNAILCYKNFATERYYNNGIFNKKIQNIGTDNYFIGGEIDSNINYTVTYIRQTNNNWWRNPMFLYRKKKFFDCTLKYKQYNQQFYIEHYFDGNWKEQNGKIRTQKCFLDKLYENN